MRAAKIVGHVLLVALAVNALLFAQSTTLTVHHSANLRSTSSTNSAIVGHLHPGDQLTEPDATRVHGFWHVRTNTGTEGWIYQTLVHVDEVDVPLPAPTTLAATDVDTTRTKPAPIGSVLPGPPGATPCPADGETGGDLDTNRRKNRKDTPTAYHAVTFDALAHLPFPDASTNRKQWSAEQLATIAPKVRHSRSSGTSSPSRSRRGALVKPPTVTSRLRS